MIRVVLVRPEAPANVGAVARIVRNTGLSGLDLVAPGDFRTIECWRTAWGAQDVLEQARVCDDLGTALHGTALAWAFSGRTDSRATVTDVREAAAAVAAQAATDTAALVFGPETSGLTLAEMALCSGRVWIPAHPDHPSLNLSHAVMVAAYEVFRAARPASGGAAPGVRFEEREALFASLTGGLKAIGALGGERESTYAEAWREFVHKSVPTRHELRMLEHLAHVMARGRERPEAVPLATDSGSPRR